MMWRRRSPSTRGCGASSAPLCRLPADFLLAPGSEREAEAADQAVSLDRGRRRRRSQVTASRGRCAAER